MSRLQLVRKTRVRSSLSRSLVVELAMGDFPLRFIGDGCIWIALETVYESSRPRFSGRRIPLGSLWAFPLNFTSPLHILLGIRIGPIFKGRHGVACQILISRPSEVEQKVNDEEKMTRRAPKGINNKTAENA